VIDRQPSRRRGPRRLLSATLATLAAVVLGGCGASAPNPAAGDASIATPLATSLQTPAGVWAAVPMGHLDQPLNTFWQLLFQPAGASRWSNQVSATAVATNGGLILTASPRALLVGVRPSNLLTFSPLLESADGGRSWSTGLLPSGLAQRPDALAAGAGGHALALVSARGGPQVLASDSGLSSWQLATSTSGLAASPAGGSCGLRAITAVAYLDGAPIVGGSCSRPGAVGLFLAHAGGWQLLTGVLPSADAHSRVEVLSVQSTSSGLRALLGLVGGDQTSLIAAWLKDGHWLSSAPLALAASERLASFGPTAESGMFVLLTAAAAAPRLAIISGAGGAWRQLPPPPSSTATVAFAAHGAVSALAVNDTVLSVWRLAAVAHRWVRGQVVNVPIEFGSSE
jgi:hypothetical protein